MAKRRNNALIMGCAEYAASKVEDICKSIEEEVLEDDELSRLTISELAHRMFTIIRNRTNFQGDDQEFLMELLFAAAKENLLGCHSLSNSDTQGAGEDEPIVGKVSVGLREDGLGYVLCAEMKHKGDDVWLYIGPLRYNEHKINAAQ
jgi:hypothetical protein